jgi:DedD protein
VARPISDEELQLKKRARRRLVGAVVLVALMAVVLPMVLDSEPEPRGQKIDIHIPSPDSGEFKPGASPPASSTVSKAASEAAPKSETAAPPADKVETPAGIAGAQPTPSARTEETAAPERAAGGTKDSSKPSAAAASAKAPAAAAGGAYVVQVAALADTSKAKALEKRIAGAGLKTYTEVVSTPNGEVTRVRAGPYATREAAEKARAQLKKAGLDGKIVPK